MTIYEILAASISVVALIISCIAIYSSNRSSNQVREAVSEIGRVNQGQQEFYINERITATKEKVAEASEKLTRLVANDKRSQIEEQEFQTLTRVFHSAVENNLNAYEVACATYRDGKVDRDRFRKIYNTEIRQLIEEPTMKSYFDPTTSRHKAILAVYKEWFDLENV